MRIAVYLGAPCALVAGAALAHKETHEGHNHVHGPDCGHIAIEHEGEIAYLHDGHLHVPHGDHYEEHAIPVSAVNPETGQVVKPQPGQSLAFADGSTLVPHGDHFDYLHAGRLYHVHGDHIEDHGPVRVLH